MTSLSYQLCVGPVHLSTCSVLSASLVCLNTDRQWNGVKMYSTEQLTKPQCTRVKKRSKAIIYFSRIFRRENVNKKQESWQQIVTPNTHTDTHTQTGGTVMQLIQMCLRLLDYVYLYVWMVACMSVRVEGGFLWCNNRCNVKHRGECGNLCCCVLIWSVSEDHFTLIFLTSYFYKPIYLCDAGLVQNTNGLAPSFFFSIFVPLFSPIRVWWPWVYSFLLVSDLL